MALSKLREGFAGRAAAVTLGAAAALSPLTGAFAQDNQPPSVAVSTIAPSSVNFVDDAGLAANLFSDQNDGVAVAVRLGTADSTPPTERIREVLTQDFRNAGLEDPVTFFFDQNDIPVTGVAYYYSGYANGPYTLGQSRDAVKEISESYNFRKANGLLASLEYDQP